MGARTEPFTATVVQVAVDEAAVSATKVTAVKVAVDDEADVFSYLFLKRLFTLQRRNYMNIPKFAYLYCLWLEARDDSYFLWNVSRILLTSCFN